MAEKIALEIDIDAKGSVRSLGQLEQEAERLNEELRKVPLGSKAFKDLQKELIGVNKEIKNTELAMEALDNEQVASELGSVAGAVGDVSAAFVLLGGSGGSLQKTVQNIERAIGISMAFKGAIEGTQSVLKLYNNLIKTGSLFQKTNNAITKTASVIMKLFSKSVNTTSNSFKMLKGAIAATGIGLLVVAIGGLVDLFTQAEEKVSNLSELFEQLNKQLQRQLNLNNKATKQQQQYNNELSRAFKIQQKNHQKRLAQLKLQGASIQTLRKEERAFEKEVINNLELQRKSSIDLEKTYRDTFMTLRREAGTFFANNSEDIKDYGKGLHLISNYDEDLKERIKLVGEQYATMRQTLSVAEKQYFNQTQTTANLQNNINLSKTQNEINEINYQIQLKNLKAKKVVNKAKKAGIKLTKKELDLQEKMAKIAYGFEILAKIEEYYSETAAMRRDSFDQELLDEQNKFEELMMNAKNFNAMLTDEEQNKRIKTEQLEEEHQERMAKIRLRQKDAEIDDSNAIKQALIDNYTARFQAEKELMASKIGLARSGLQVLGAIAGEESKLQNALFVLDKALAIGEIIVNTQREIAGISASYATIPGGQLVAAPLIAAAKIRAATGIATVVATSLAKFKGGGAGGATSALGGGAATASPGQAPPLQPANTSLLVPQQQNQVYVTETDITNVQNQVAVIQGMGGFN